MKKLIFVLIAALVVIGAISAQNWDNWQRTSQTVTVNGTLQLQNGFVAVGDGDSVYLVPMLERYIGFIDGLKEGARVLVEGYAFGNMLQPSKVTIDGKSYDFLANGFGPQGRGGYGPMRGGFGMRGGGPGWCW